MDNKIWLKIQFVTGNPNKAREASEILGFNISHTDPGELIEMQTNDISALVEHKALQAYNLIKSPILVEDSGLFFEAWNGLPGVLVKWFEQSLGCKGLIKMLSSFENRAASALCCVAVNDGTQIRIAKGLVAGSIANEIRGVNGFGWDSIFIPNGYEQTFGEMSTQEKNSISHRKRAFDNLKSIL